MFDRYEIRKYNEEKHRSPGGRKRAEYGVWDKRHKRWVINTTGVSKDKAINFFLVLVQKK